MDICHEIADFGPPKTGAHLFIAKDKADFMNLWTKISQWEIAYYYKILIICSIYVLATKTFASWLLSL